MASNQSKGLMIANDKDSRDETGAHDNYFFVYK